MIYRTIISLYLYVIISGNGKRKALFQEEFWEKGITSWEPPFKVNAARKSKVDDNTARMQSIKQLGV